MDLEIIILSEISQTEKDKCHMISLIHEILKTNMIQMNLFTKWTHGDLENKSMVTK